MRCTSICLIFFIWLFAPTLASGQGGTSTLRGVVTDPNGEKILGAQITARNIATGTEHFATSGDDGNYTIPVVPAGFYRVTVEAHGFSKQTLDGVELKIGLTTVASFVLNPGEVSETVSVSAEAVTLQTTDASIGTTFNAREIQPLPVNSPNFQALVTLSPGVSPPSSNPAKTMASENMSGLRSDRGLVSLDGLDVGSPQSGRVDINVSADAIEQFRVEAGVLPAEIGRGGGSAISVVLKSGGDQYHGSGYFGLRDDKLQARGPFGGPLKPSYDLQRFGGTIGGRIWPNSNRLFFFFSVERVRDNGATTVGRRDQTARRIVPSFAPTPSRSTLVSARIDAQLPFEHSLFGQYVLKRYGGTNPGFSHDGKLQDPSNFQAQQDSAQRLAGGWTHPFTKTLVNELRFGVSSIDEKSNPLTTEPQIVFPSINVGANYLADRNSIERSAQIKDDLTWVYGNHVLKFGGNYRHISLPQPNNFNLFAQGIIVVPCDFPGNPGCPNATADLQIPVSVAFVNREIVTGGFQGFGRLGAIPPIDNDTLDLYGQDTWKVTPKLTLSLGLRWEYDHDFIGRNQVNKSNPRRRNQKRNKPDPRVSILWVLKIPIRGGLGWFHQTNFLTTRQLELLADGVRLPILRAVGTKLGDPFANLLPNAPPDIFVTSNALSQPSVRQISIGADLIGPENSPDSKFSLSATFISSRGRRFPRLVEVNRQPDGTRVNPSFGSVLETRSIIKAAYDGFELDAKQKLSRLGSLNVGFTSSYTLSRSLDEDNDPLGFITTVSNPSRPEFDRGPASYESRHSFRLSGIIELPKQIGVTFAPFVRAYSSRPVEIVQNHDFSEGIGSNAVRLPGLGRNAGNRQVRTGADINRIIDGFNANATFVAAHGGPIAHVDPKINLAHPYFRLDLGVYRTFHLKEPMNLEVRADANNVLNRVNVTGIQSENPSGLQNNVESPNFGRPFGITPGGVFGFNSPRAFVLSAKLTF
jgi:outer membrane receptor protein involved in Fe transport